MVQVALVHGIVREEERLLLNALTQHPVIAPRLVHESDQAQITPDNTDCVLIRSVSHHHARTIAFMLERRGLLVVNPSQTIELCGDKIRTAIALEQGGVPQPRFRTAFSVDEALRRMDEVGYPLVLKPPVGSWGRLLAKVNDRDAAEALLEHKQVLGGPQHHVYFLQEYIPQAGHDIRVFIAGGTPLAAIERHADHWINNTARGATVANRPLDEGLRNLAIAASAAVGGGLLAIDVLVSNGEYLVNEVNDRMEFKNSIAPTGVDLPQRVAEYLVQHVGVFV
ncbi:MAG: lysine biosynthesis protein LysX [Acidobacteria bacterium]|nr:lysine biosynthesis protein LysX [Acidobacteriota bacterium]